MKQPHPHANLIKEWADGADIEFYSPTLKKWIPMKYPSWEPQHKYRVALTRAQRLLQLPVGTWLLCDGHYYIPTQKAPVLSRGVAYQITHKLQGDIAVLNNVGEIHWLNLSCGAQALHNFQELPK